MIEKSNNLKHVPDGFFDDIENQLYMACEKYGDIGKQIIANMKCQHCENEIDCSYEEWGTDTIAFANLRCKKCSKTYGITGFRVYKLNMEEIVGIRWLIHFLSFLIKDIRL